MELRDYQQNAVEQVREAFFAGLNPILCSPTGSGKTVMAREIVQRIGKRCVWTVHRRELEEQAAEHLAGIPDVEVISIQKIGRRGLPACDYVVIDECHHAAASSYRACLGVPRIGLSATPARLDGKPLGELFGRIIIAAHTDDLIRDGFLLMPRMFAGEAPDLHGIKKTAGDYNIGALGRCVNKPILVGDAVQHWKRHANGYRTIAFAVDIAHSKSIVEAFRSAGVVAEHVDGSTPKDERKAILARLRSGETTLVSNVGIATEGFDLPALECVILLRPTESLVLQIQMFGRVMRPNALKRTPIVLDHAGNWHRHHYRGDNRYEWSLNGRVKKANVAANLGLKRCPECYALVDNGLDACPHCGDVFTVAKRKLSIVDGELVEVSRGAPPNRIARWIQLLDIAHESQRCKVWAISRYRVEFGMWPSPPSGPGEDFEETDTASDGLKIWAYKNLMAHSKMYPESFKYTSAKTDRAWAAGRYEEIFRRWPTKDVIASVPKDPSPSLFDLVLKESRS